MTITRNFNLHLNAGSSIPLVVNANQYDQGEEWVFTLYTDRGIKYTPSSGAICGIKSDGMGIINMADVNEDGQVVVEETQQMTAAPGKAIYSLMIDDDTHYTANFIVMVEQSPLYTAIVSDSDLSLIQEALNSVTPQVIAQEVTDWMDDNITQPTTPVVDASLSVQGAAADAKATGDAIAMVNSAIATITGIPTSVRQAMMTLFNSALYKVTGLTDEKAVIQSWASEVTAISLNKSTSTINGASTDVIVATTTPSGGTVTWESLNTAVATVDNTGLVTGVSNGAAVIKATCGDFFATCTVTVYGFATLTSISAVYTQSGVVNATTPLDDLKPDLVVTAHYDDSTSSVLNDNDYTLAGTLTEGTTSTITVAYRDKTTTFNVVVTKYIYELSSAFSSTGSNYIDTGFSYEKSKTYTLLCDHTKTSRTAPVNFIYSNKKGGVSTNYLGLQCQYTAAHDHLWGMGVSWNNSQDKGALDKRYRSVSVLAINSDGTSSATMKWKNVTDSSAVATFTNSYSTDVTDSTKTKTLALGDSSGDGTGFVGTIHDFKVYVGELSAEEIADYLANGG